MDKKVASEIIDLMVECGEKFNSSIIKVEKAVPSEEAEQYKKNMGKIMGSMLLDVINPIIKEHPDLKPKELD